MFHTQKINDIKIKPLITHTTDPKKILGSKMFLDPYSNCAIISKKKSGKTNLLYNILKKITRGGNFPTNVFIYCSTIHKDKTYKHILSMLEDRGCIVSSFTHFKEDKINMVEELLNEFKEESDSSDTSDNDGESSDSDIELCRFDNKKKLKERKMKKPSKLSAKYVFIFDDLGNDLRNKVITQLSKTLRHYLARTFFLSQYLTDLEPSCIKQLDYAILFKSFNHEKLKSIHQSLDLSIDFNDFVKIYEFATKEKYNFLYIDVRNEQFRHNFDVEIIMDDTNPK